MPIVPISLMLFMVLIWAIKPAFQICQKGFVYSLARIFIHVNAPHLLFNLAAFYQIDRLIADQQATVVSLIIMVNATIDYLVYGLGYSHCSIGFSGVIFGLITYLYLRQKISASDLIKNLSILLVPSMLIPNISFIGHLEGIISGFLVYLLISVGI